MTDIIVLVNVLTHYAATIWCIETATTTELTSDSDSAINAS